MPLLDAAFLVDVLRGNKKAAALFSLLRQESAPLGTCPHVHGELHKGVGLSDRPDEQRRMVDELLKALAVFEFTPEAAKVAGRLQAEWTRKGKAASPLDLLLGCTALHHGEALVTRNRRHFEGIPGLEILAY